MTMTTTIPAGWKLVPEIMTLDMCVAFAEVWFSKVRCIDDHDMQDAYAAMLDAAPAAPGVSTVEDAGVQKVVIDFDQVGSAGPFHVIDGRVTIPAVTVMDLVRMAAPAAGDAQVLAALKQAHMALIGFMPQHRNSVIVSAIVAAREAIDAALAAQRKGDA